MPHYRYHVLGALFAFFVLFVGFRAVDLILTPAVWFFSLLVCLFSSLIPDIDSKKSKIYRITMDLIVIIIAILIIIFMFDNFSLMLWLLLFWFLISGVLHLPFKHRGFIHSIWVGIFYAFVIGLISLILLETFVPGFFAFLGYFSHLVLDKRI